MIGGTVARLAVTAGYDVVLSNSRHPETLAELITELGPRATARTATEAAEAGEFVVVSVPFKVHPELPIKELTGKVVLDTNNYYPERDGHFAEIDNGSLTSAELEQRHLAGIAVVKVFNNIFFKHLAGLHRPAGAPDRTALPLAGDDAEAKRTATAFLDTIGYDAVDIGPLSESWRVEPGQPAYGPPYGGNGATVSTPAGADVIKAAVAAAKR